MRPEMKDYINYLAHVRNLSPATLKSYETDLVSWLDFTDSRKNDFLTADRQLARAYLSLLSLRSMAGSSLNRRLSTLRGFYEYLVREGKTERNPFRELRNLHQPRRLPRYLTAMEIETLIELTGQDFQGKRDKVLFELLFSTGCRVSELCSLNVSQVTRNSMIVRGKGDRDRYVFIGGRAREALDEYLTLRETHPSQDEDSRQALILDLQGKRLTTRGVYYLVQQYARKAGFAKKISPHSFRHGYATEMMNEGADIRIVQELLGHVSLSTTQIYTHTGIDRMKQIYREAHPHARKKGVQ